MIPILTDNYPYTGNGLGGLSDAIECKVEHEVNGIYELSMRYPITGIHYDEILKNYFIMADPDNMTQAQPFRIYRITKPLNGVVTIYARHIAYDMMGTIVEPFTQTSLTAAILDLANHCTPATTFTFSTTRSVASPFKLSEPRELWRVLGGSAGSFLDVYGGEWDFDRLNVTLKTRLGADRGVHIRYGKNMTGLEQDATIESTYSGVWPFWYDADAGTLVQISEKFVAVAGAAVSDRVLLLDCTDDFETQPSEQDLRNRANEYITANSVGDPKLTWKVSFVQLAQAGEQAVLEQVMLGDTLHVYYEDLGVNATARAVKTVYDVLADHYKEVTVGRVKQNLASIIVDQNKETENKIATTKSALEQAIDRSTDFIKNGAGYMRMIYNSSNELVEIVSLDNPDISLAQNVWRWNNGGFGFSSTGYNGTYGLALTQAGEIVADYITTGTLNANVIRAGIIADTQGYNSWNLGTGFLVTTSANIGGFTIDATSIRSAALTSAGQGSIGLSTQDFTRSINGTSRTGLRFAIGSNFAVDKTGTLYASNGTFEGAITSSSATITGGSINIVTSSNTDSRIQLSYGGVDMKLSASRLTFTVNGTETGIYGNTLVLGGQNIGNGSVNLRYGSGDGILLSTSLESMRIYNSSNQLAAEYASHGIYFYNASGTQTAEYPSGGFTYYGGTAITSNVPSGTSTAVRSLTLQPGRYIIWGQTAWGVNATGRRNACIGTDSTNVNSGAAWDFRGASPAGETRQSLSAYVTPATATTYYLVLYQNSGTTLAMSAYGLYAIKLP